MKDILKRANRKCWDILTLTEVFVNQKRVDLFERKIKMPSMDNTKSEEVSRWKMHVKEHTENGEKFDTHWGLCQSKQGGYMWIHNKDATKIGI